MKGSTLCAVALAVVALAAAPASADRRATESASFLFVMPVPADVSQAVVFEGSLTGRCVRLRTISHADLVDLSPNGRLLAVVRQEAGASSLSVITLKTGRERVILRGQFTQPIWSPDSRLLAVPMLGPRRSIDLVDVSTARRRTLVAAAALPASWSPDGRRLVFVTAPRPPGDAFLVSAEIIGLNGQGRRLLKRERHLGVGPWSPDGASLLLRTHPRVGVEALTLLDVDTEAARVVASRKHGFSMPVWSPDGLQIAFGSRPHARTRVHEVFHASVVDGAIRRVTRTRSSGYPTWPGSEALAWSPGSDLILYHGETNVGVIKPDSTGKRALCKLSPDGPISDAVWPTR